MWTFEYLSSLCCKHETREHTANDGNNHSHLSKPTNKMLMRITEERCPYRQQECRKHSARPNEGKTLVPYKIRSTHIDYTGTPQDYDTIHDALNVF